MIRVLVCAVPSVHLHTTQVWALYLMRTGRGGKSYHLTEKQLLCHVIYTIISPRRGEIFEQYGNSDNRCHINEMSMRNKQAESEKPAGGHHDQPSDNNKFSE